MMCEHISPNTVACQEATKLFLEQFLLRPATVVANLNALLADTRYELVLKEVDSCKHFDKEQQQFPFSTGERLMGSQL